PPRSRLCPYTTLFRSQRDDEDHPVKRTIEEVLSEAVEDKAIDRLEGDPDIGKVVRHDPEVINGGASGGHLDNRHFKILVGQRTLDRKSTRLNSSHVKI